MTTFKVGDRVRLIGGTHAAKHGAEAVVTRENYTNYFGSSSKLIDVKWDRKVNDLAQHQADGGYYVSEFELVSPAAPAEYILIVKTRTGYEPAAYPKVYTSEAQALAVADKMAKQYGGEFVVFKTIASSTLPPPVTPAPVVKRFA